MENAGPLIVPSDIPWPQYVGEALEELLYWLCDALGAKELEWRAGSSHGTSRDRGRDLEATFHVPMADAEVHAQRWWIQAKGRSGTVSPSVVRDAVVEVLAHKGVDVLVVATNSRFSNDTRDWVAEFQESHPRPLIRLWDRDTLERMLVGTPSVVARVAPGALSLAGRLEAVAASFWDKQQLPTTGLLDEFWSQRAELTFDPRALLAVVVGDAAAGHLPLHPWGAEVDAEPLIECVAFALANFAPLLFRFERTGLDDETLMAGVAHLLACALIKTSAATIAGLLSDPWRFVDGAEVKEESRAELSQRLFAPLVDRLLGHFGTACLQDCVRVMGEFEPESRIRPEHRFLELLPTSVPRDDVIPDPRMLLIEKQDAPCRAGLSLSADHGCPFGADDHRPWPELLAEVRLVLLNRLTTTVAERRPQDGDDDPGGESN